MAVRRLPYVKGFFKRGETTNNENDQRTRDRDKKIQKENLNESKPPVPKPTPIQASSTRKRGFDQLDDECDDEGEEKKKKYSEEEKKKKDGKNDGAGKQSYAAAVNKNGAAENLMIKTNRVIVRDPERDIAGSGFRDARSNKFMDRGVYCIRKNDTVMDDYVKTIIEKFGNDSIEMAYQVSFKRIELIMKTKINAIELSQNEIMVKDKSVKFNLIVPGPINYKIKNIMPWLTVGEITNALLPYGKVVFGSINHEYIEKSQVKIRTGTIQIAINKKNNTFVPKYIVVKIGQDYHRWYIAPADIKCYNCGGGGHWMKFCEKDFNRDLINKRYQQERGAKTTQSTTQNDDGEQHNIQTDNLIDLETNDQEEDKDNMTVNEVEGGEENVCIEFGEIGNISQSDIEEDEDMIVVQSDDVLMGFEHSSNIKDNHSQREMVEDEYVNGEGCVSGEDGDEKNLPMNGKVVRMDEKQIEHFDMLEDIIVKDLESRKEDFGISTCVVVGEKNGKNEVLLDGKKGSAVHDMINQCEKRNEKNFGLSIGEVVGEKNERNEVSSDGKRNRSVGDMIDICEKRNEEFMGQGRKGSRHTRSNSLGLDPQLTHHQNMNENGIGGQSDFPSYNSMDLVGREVEVDKDKENGIMNQGAQKIVMECFVEVKDEKFKNSKEISENLMECEDESNQDNGEVVGGRNQSHDSNELNVMGMVIEGEDTHGDGDQKDLNRLLDDGDPQASGVLLTGIQMTENIDMKEDQDGKEYNLSNNSFNLVGESVKKVSVIVENCGNGDQKDLSRLLNDGDPQASGVLLTENPMIENIDMKEVQDGKEYNISNNSFDLVGKNVKKDSVVLEDSEDSDSGDESEDEIQVSKEDLIASRGRKIRRGIVRVLREGLKNKIKKHKIYSEGDLERFLDIVDKNYILRNGEYFKEKKLDVEINNFLIHIKKYIKEKGTKQVPLKLYLERISKINPEKFNKRIKYTKDGKKMIPACNSKLIQIIKTVDQAIVVRNEKKKIPIEFFKHIDVRQLKEYLEKKEILDLFKKNGRLADVYAFWAQLAQYRKFTDYDREFHERIFVRLGE